MDETNGGKNNAQFLRIDQPKKYLAFTFMVTNLYIGNRGDYFYFLRERSILYWKWGSKKYSSVRCMPKLKYGSKDVASKQYTFQAKFDEAVENCYLMEGFVHINDEDPDECVTLNFRGNGLYTFKTKAQEI